METKSPSTLALIYSIFTKEKPNSQLFITAANALYEYIQLLSDTQISQYEYNNKALIHFVLWCEHKNALVYLIKRKKNSPTINLHLGKYNSALPGLNFMARLWLFHQEPEFQDIMIVLFPTLAGRMKHNSWKALWSDASGYKYMLPWMCFDEFPVKSKSLQQMQLLPPTTLDNIHKLILDYPFLHNINSFYENNKSYFL